VVTHLILVRITEKRVERSAGRDVRRPGVASVSAVGVEQLGVGVVRGISSIEPNHINSAVRCNCRGAEPMPFLGIRRIIIDPSWGRKGLAAIGALSEHDVAGAYPGISYTGDHVDIVIRAAARVIEGEEDLS